jgi:hypothetical protein
MKTRISAVKRAKLIQKRYQRDLMFAKTTYGNKQEVFDIGIFLAIIIGLGTFLALWPS